MNLLDMILIFALAFGFLSGFRRGVVKQGILTIGIFLVVFLSFSLKNPLSIVLYKHLPFYTVGILKNYSILNILLYELISFFILLSIFSLIFAILTKISGIVERLLRATIILALPSKILGGVLGIIEYYIFSFIVLIIITMPIFTISNETFIAESKLKDKILNNTFLISKVSGGLINSINSVNDLLDDENKLGTEEFNCKTLNVFIENKIVSIDSVNYLKEDNKIDKTCKIKSD